MFDQDLRQAMQVDADGHSFSTRFKPENTGLLVLDVLDEDQLGSAKPTRLFLRVTEDQPPEVENRVTGIGNLITPTARIPGFIRVRDDYGLTALEPMFRIATGEQDDPTADEVAELELRAGFHHLVEVEHGVAVLAGRRVGQETAGDRQEVLVGIDRPGATKT